MAISKADSNNSTLPSGHTPYYSVLSKTLRTSEAITRGSLGELEEHMSQFS